jgi:glutathione synthase
MRWLFVMDPVESINIKKDTTFAIMAECARRGIETWYCTIDTLAVSHQAGVWATCQQLHAIPGTGVQKLGEPAPRTALKDFPVIWMRKDPPFNMAFFYATLLLEQAEQAGCLVLNRQAGLRAANEKAFVLNFPQFAPTSIITRRADDIRMFLAEMGGKAVLKPLDLMGGSGIFLLREDDANLGTIIEQSTRYGEESVMVQRFLPEAREGDKRVLLMDGEILGGLLRVPQGNEFRGNLAAGGKAVDGGITDRDREIVDGVLPTLRKNGLWFVGLDVIGGNLTEVNVTSPTGMQEIDRFASARGQAGPTAAERTVDGALGLLAAHDAQAFTG